MLTGANRSAATAVRVTARRTKARGNPLGLTFAALLGRTSVDVSATSIAASVRTRKSQNQIAATANPWLAGMKQGTKANKGNPANNPDKAPENSPQAITDLTLEAGMALSFDSIVGSANNGPVNGTTMFTPDGNTGSVLHNYLGAEHGKADVYAPVNAVMGVFLGPADPDLSAAPYTLDFTTAPSRDFLSLSPQLKQVFFIGDGRTSAGDIQRFIVPAGATRLYIGIMDGYEWNNNSGSFTVTIYLDDTPGLVR